MTWTPDLIEVKVKLALQKSFGRKIARLEFEENKV
jgi:hypothetical protein